MRIYCRNTVGATLYCIDYIQLYMPLCSHIAHMHPIFYTTLTVIYRTFRRHHLRKRQYDAGGDTSAQPTGFDFPLRGPR